MVVDVEKRRKQSRDSKKRTYMSRRDSILKNRYGIVEFDYEELAKKQDNKCAICNSPPTTKRLDLDHCHTTKKIRGLLCNNCNRGLGHFKDNIELLNKAVKYLKPPVTSVDMAAPVVCDCATSRYHLNGKCGWCYGDSE